MKNYHVLGITEVCYTKDGKTVEGVKLHLGSQRDGTDGLAVSTAYVSSKTAELYDEAISLNVGEVVHLLYEVNDYGRPELTALEVVTGD